ncbi:disease resistance protein PIK6-NP-like [Aegilops tauschii subsp. strangulata]|uniref:disease resistance protein PIK6-NP-like n=1 Tax=Aegilops tauschii subsp. strangulata TaxID=200361 RepID=UPI003CC8AC81
MLVARGFIRPVDISDACNIKTCTLHHEASEFIARIAIDVNFVDTDLPQGFAQHLSIHNRIPLQACHPPREVANDIVASLPYLAKSSQWKLLKVMDLEGCRGLKKKHLKIICKIILLRYFSLRNTDVTELPKQIEMLTCLETLDIRQTAVRAFATKSIMLPMLKHMLAGESQTCPPPSNHNPERFQESFVGVRLPNGVQRMGKLEMLSHVDVSHSVDDMISIGQLLQLRKLGVILDRKKRDGLLDLLFQQIEKLHGCLRSLSIQVNHPVTSDGVIIHDDADEVHALGSPPKLLRSLNIRGIRNGLLGWIAELDKLVKLTLSETYLGEDALGIIGNLGVLACLRLLHKSYNGSKLHIKKGEFISLKSLIVRGNDITSIHFEGGASPKLEMFVWSFARMEAMDGLDELYHLKKVELYGDCNPQPLRDQMWRRLDFKHNGQQVFVQRHSEDVVAV